MSDEPQIGRFVTYIRSPGGYGRNLWLGKRVVLHSPGALTPMKPHIYKGWDEFCNPTINLHLWPLFGVGVWYGWHQRDYDDGRCEQCNAEDS